MKSFWGILFLVFPMKSCILIHVDDSVDLGNSYRYIQSNPRTIINNRGSQNKDIGQIVVGPHVVEYKFDDTYIIAKTQNEIYIHDSLKVFTFWMVNKETGMALEFSKLNDLNEQLNRLNIGLMLNE